MRLFHTATKDVESTGWNGWIVNRDTYPPWDFSIFQHFLFGNARSIQSSLPKIMNVHGYNPIYHHISPRNTNVFWISLSHPQDFTQVRIASDAQNVRVTSSGDRLQHPSGWKGHLVGGTPTPRNDGVSESQLGWWNSQLIREHNK